MNTDYCCSAVQYNSIAASLVREYHSGCTECSAGQHSSIIPFLFLLLLKLLSLSPGLFVSGTNLRDGKLSSDNLIIPSYSRRAGGEGGEGPVDHQGNTRPVEELQGTTVTTVTTVYHWFWQFSSPPRDCDISTVRRVGGNWWQLSLPFSL